jgi:outer membrane autotransporter protein
LNLGMTAAFTGAPDATFDAIGQGLARNTAQVGVNLSTQINDRWSWYVNGDVQGDHGRSHDVSANAGIEFKF